MKNFLTVLGGIEFILIVAVCLFALACWFVRLDARRKDAAQLTAMDADETRRWREWAGSDAGFLFASPEFVDSSPIYTEVLVEQMRRDLAEWGKGDVA